MRGEDEVGLGSAVATEGVTETSMEPPLHPTQKGQEARKVKWWPRAQRSSWKKAKWWPRAQRSSWTKPPQNLGGPEAQGAPGGAAVRGLGGHPPPRLSKKKKKKKKKKKRLIPIAES